MVPSGLNKELYLPLPVPSACPHNSPLLTRHYTLRTRPQPQGTRLKLQAVSQPACSPSVGGHASRWAWALLAPCYACLHDATGTSLVMLRSYHHENTRSH